MSNSSINPPPIAVDYKDSLYISQILADAIETYNQIAFHRAGDDITNACLALQDAGTKAYRAMEYAYKNCLYRYYDTKYQNGRMTEIDYLSKLRFKTAKGFKTHLDLKNDFVAITKPAPTVDLALIFKGASKYNNRIKHAAETTDQDFEGLLPILKEIISFYKTYIVPDFFFPEPTLKFQRRNVAWQELKDDLHGFRDSCQYILVAPECIDTTMRNMSYLFSAPWHLVLDFNPASEENGLKYMHLSSTQIPSDVRLLLFQTDPYPFSPVPHWIMANGFRDQGHTIAPSFLGWSRKYGQHLLKNLRMFKSSYPKYLQVVILPGLSDSYLRFVVEQFANLGVQSDGTTIEGVDIFLIDDYGQCPDLEDIIPYHLYRSNCSLEDMLDGLASDEQGLILHSTRKELPHVNPDDPQFPKLCADLETFSKPVYIGIEELEDNSDNHIRDFYRGARAISWKELNSHLDLERRGYSDYLDRLKNNIKQHPKSFHKIPYLPGCGGSTLLRRIAWDLHTMCPTLMVEHYDTQCIHILRSLQHKLDPGIPILILADCNYISESAVLDIRTDLNTNGISHIIIHVQRRNKQNRNREPLFDLYPLSIDGEVSKMVDLLRPHIPNESHANSVVNILSKYPEDNKDIYSYTPFYIALAAFDEEFAGIGNYVAHHLDELSQDEKIRLLYIALGNEISIGLNMEFFAYQMRRNLSSEAESTLRQRPAFEELVRYETDRGQRSCMIRYPRFAKEILVQVTSGKDAKQINYIRLAERIQDFITASRPNSSITNVFIEDFLRAMLINRDPDVDALQPTFSNIISHIGTEGKDYNPRLWQSQLTAAGISAMGNVFQKLTDVYPENTHFVAHRARYLSYVERNYPEALRILDDALRLSETNGNEDSRLWHMKGMAYTARITNKHIEDIKKTYNETKDLNACTDLIATLHTDLRHAQDIFAHVRKLIPSDISGYISEISLCVNIIEMGKSIEKSDTATFLADHKGDWYMDLADRLNCLFDECEGLEDSLDDVKKKYLDKTRKAISPIREGIENTIRLYEDYLDEASESEQPAVRRHLARAYMESKTMDSAEKWEKIVALMERNMQAEPNNSSNIRTWFKAKIHIPSSNPTETLRKAVICVSDWISASENNVEAHFYRYILTFLQAVEGDTSAESYLPGYLAKLKNLTNNLPNKTSIRYWLGDEGEGLQRLIHKSDFQTEEVKLAKSRLYPVRGRVLSVVSPRQAYIRSYGTEVFFDPTATDGRITERDKNASVFFGMGFSYDGPRAYNSSVEHRTSTQGSTINMTELTYGTRVIGMVTSNNGNKFITVDLIGYEAEGWLYIDNFIAPYSDMDRPALGTILSLSIVKPQWIPNRQGHRRLIWIVNMPQDDPAPEKTSGLSRSNLEKLKALHDKLNS